MKLEEILKHDGELFAREPPDELVQVVGEVLSDVVALHHVDCEPHEVHVLHSRVGLQDFLGNVER